MADTTTPPLRFGIEIEALFHPTVGNLEFLHYEFALELASGRPDVRSCFQEDKKETKMWRIVADQSIRGHKKHGPLALEFVSPILRHDPAGAWQAPIRDMFTHIESKCTLSSNETCGFHVHVSPGGMSPEVNEQGGREQMRWTVEELRSISFAIIYFDEALLALMPEHRQNSFHLKSNYADNKQLNGLTKNECWTRLHDDDLKGPRDFFTVVQDGDSECEFAWNFGNLEGDKKTSTTYTIEWRQPPAVTTVEDCLAWTELALEFVQAAMDWVDIGHEIQDMYRADVEGLRSFLQDKGKSTAQDRTLMNRIFEGKSGTVKPVKPGYRINYPERWEEEHPDDPLMG